MMLNKFINFLLLIIASSAFFCSGDPDKAFNDSIKNFKKGKTHDADDIGKQYIKLISTDKFKNTDFETNGKLILNLSNSKIDILFPEKKYISIPGIKKIESYDINEYYFIICDEKKIYILDSNGRYQKNIHPGDDKSSIKSIMLFEDKIIYCLGHMLKGYNIATNSHFKLTNEKFIPPYKKYYQVKLYRSGDSLGILTGTAGLYYFSMIDINTNKIKVKNISTSSKKLYVDEKKLCYIIGSSGNWELTRFIFKNKSKKILARFNDLIDIELTPTGVIYEDKKGLWLMNYGEQKTSVPFSYELKGKYKDKVLLKHNDNIHICNMNMLVDKIKILKKRIPEIFNNKPSE